MKVSFDKFLPILLEILFLEFKLAFDLSAVEGIVGKGKGGIEKRRYSWSSSWCEKQGARLRGEELNSEEDMEVNGLTDGE